jgi:Mn2+/Fe2+ NRAMP family transporter
MFAPGLVAAVFYRRRPSRAQIALGVAFTVVFSGLLGYVQDAGTSRVWENVVLAIVFGMVLYAAILAYLAYVYFPKRERDSAPPNPQG